MTKKQIEQLKAVIAKIDENTLNVWQTDLSDTKPAVILDDFINNVDDSNPVIYNGWYEDLKKLLK